jgi:hypothetical protein
MLNNDLNGHGSHDGVNVGPFHLQTYKQQCTFHFDSREGTSLLFEQKAG